MRRTSLPRMPGQRLPDTWGIGEAVLAESKCEEGVVLACQDHLLACFDADSREFDAFQVRIDTRPETP